MVLSNPLPGPLFPLPLPLPQPLLIAFKSSATHSKLLLNIEVVCYTPKSCATLVTTRPSLSLHIQVFCYTFQAVAAHLSRLLHIQVLLFHRLASTARHISSETDHQPATQKFRRHVLAQTCFGNHAPPPRPPLAGDPCHIWALPWLLSGVPPYLLWHHACVAQRPL